MLFKLQNQLIKNQNKVLEIAQQCRFEDYLAFKQAFYKFPKNRMTSVLKTYFLLTALLHKDYRQAHFLFETYDYKNMTDTASQIALGRFYAKFKVRTQATYYLLPIFKNNKLDFVSCRMLLEMLSETAQYKECDQVIQFLLKEYPDTLEVKIDVSLFQINTAHLFPRSRQEILNNLNYLVQRCVTADHFLQIANCFFLAGCFDKAVDLSFQALEKVSYSFKATASDYEFNSSLCLDSMNVIIDVLSETLDIKAFPVFGSLLGLVRDGKFMDYDKDADLGIFIENTDEIVKIVKTLCSHTRFTAPSIISAPKASNVWNIAIYDGQNSTGIDLFFFYKQPAHFETGIYTACGILKWAFSPFELVQGTLAGKTYWLPENVEQHLTELYNNWKEPVEAWDSLLNCPNLTKDSSHASVLYGLLRLYQALQDGKTKKALNYYQTLSTRFGMQFSPQAEANIKKLLSLI